MKKEFIKYIISNYLSVVLNVLRTIVLAKIVLPEVVGIWSIINTFAGYFRYNNLGLNALAFYRGKRKNVQNLYSNLLLKSNSALALTFGTIYSALFILTQYKSLNVDINWKLMLLLFFVTIVGVQISETYVTINKLNSNFNTISYNTNILSILQFSLVLIGAFTSGMLGILIGNSISIILSLLYLVKVTKYKKYHINISLSRLLLFFRGAISGITPGFLYIAYTTIDIFVIKEKFGLVENGYYAIVFTLINVILIAPSSLAAFLYSKNPNRLVDSKNYVYKITIANFLTCSLLVLASYVILFLIANYFLPKYTRSIAIFSLIFYSIPFLSIKNGMVDILIAKSKQYLYNVVLFIIIILKVSVLFFVSNNTFYSTIAGFNILLGVLTLLIYHFVERKKTTMNTLVLQQ